MVVALKGIMVKRGLRPTALPDPLLRPTKQRRWVRRSGFAVEAANVLSGSGWIAGCMCEQAWLNERQGPCLQKVPSG